MRGLLPVILLLAGCGTGAEPVSPVVSASSTPDLLDASTTAVFDEKAWEHWIDADGDCQDTRQEVLIASSTLPVVFQTARQCNVASGQWTCPYTGQVFIDPSMLAVAPLFSMASAHTAGGHAWNADKRRDYANQIEGKHLVAISRTAEASKAQQGPDLWLPPFAECQYILDWISIAMQWQLKVNRTIFELHTSRCLATMAKPIVSFDTPTDFDSYSDDLQGFRFTIGPDDVSVAGLGFFDAGRDGLYDAHPVGIYHVNSRQLVSKAIVPKGNAGRLEGDFRYTAIPEVLLSANTSYVALSYRPSSRQPDPIASTVTGLKVLPGITLNTEIGINHTGGLLFHNRPFGAGGKAWFGPSLLVVVKSKR